MKHFIFFSILSITLSAAAVEYTDGNSAEE